MAHGVYCQATLNYFDGAVGRPMTVDVLDGRRAADDLEFEACGFQLVEHESAVTDWHDHAQVDRVHRPEAEALVTEITGCDVAISYPPIHRSREEAQKTPDYAPIELVHSDFTDDYGPMITDPDRRYRAFLDPLLESHGLGHADVRSATRLMVLQFWRNTGPKRPDYPLAFCAADGVGPDRLVREMLPEYGGLRVDSQFYAVRPPDDADPDRWYTFPDLTTAEAVALRTYDSRCVDESRPFWTPHSAFRDPNVPAADRQYRKSVESRVLCIWR
jgi:hypothetical protein